FGRALDRLTAEPGIGWAELAAAEGYADQPHFTREFRALAGVTPGVYRRRAPSQPRHLAL
ncbi:MAG TPA: helix-turn-helix domain-containing protein, partial [Kiloniellaceae bacterium]